MPKKKKKSEAGGTWDMINNRLGNYVIGGLLIIAGPALSIGAWSSVKEGRASESWPTVPCERTIAGALVMGDQTWSRPLQRLIIAKADITPIRPALLAGGADALTQLATFFHAWQKAPV